MTRVRILDPTAPPPVVDADPGPDAGALVGRTVGIRYDNAWRSWKWVIDDWEPRLRSNGADVVRWCAGNRIGDEGAETFTALDHFSTDVDIALIGLGN
jgi:hypothetical protein